MERKYLIKGQVHQTGANIAADEVNFTANAN